MLFSLRGRGVFTYSAGRAVKFGAGSFNESGHLLKATKVMVDDCTQAKKDSATG